MADITLAAEPREERGSRPSGRIRRTGRVPAVVYGLGADAVAVTVPARELSHILAGESGANSLINLTVGGDTQLTLARQIQRHPTRGELLHVDFVRIRRDVAITAEVPIHLVGEAVGVKDGGVLEQSTFHLTVEAKPADIPVSIEVDISELPLGGQVRIADLQLPRGVAATHDGEELVVHVVAPRGAEVGEGEGAEGEGAAEAAAGEPAEGADGE